MFLPRKSRGWKILVGYSPWVVKSRIGLSDFTFTVTYWRRKWQPTPVLLPGKSHGRRSLVGYSPWGQSWTQLSNFSFTFISTKFIVFTISSLEPSSPNPLSNWIDSFYSINTSKFPQYTCMSRDPPTHCPFTER